MLALSLLCLALVALLAYREWGGRRDRAAERELRNKLEADRVEARHEAARERAALYQRIQAPETAVLEHVRAERGPYVRRKPIGPDDDRAYVEKGNGAESG